MIKANKKQNESNLESDFEKRGKGCRKKTASSRVLFDINSSDDDNDDDIHPMAISSEIQDLKASLPLSSFPTLPPKMLKSASKRTFNSITTPSPSTSSSTFSPIVSTLVDNDKCFKPVCPLIGTRYSKNKHRCSSSELCFISGELKI